MIDTRKARRRCDKPYVGVTVDGDMLVVRCVCGVCRAPVNVINAVIK